jgi:antitoxin ParD1/3/4
MITLKPEQEQFILKQLESGKFTNADQVINQAFTLLEKINDDYWQWVEETRQKIDIAITELDNSEGLDGETVINEILERFKQAR